MILHNQSSLLPECWPLYTDPFHPSEGYLLLTIPIPRSTTPGRHGQRRHGRRDRGLVPSGSGRRAKDAFDQSRIASDGCSAGGLAEARVDLDWNSGVRDVRESKNSRCKKFVFACPFFWKHAQSPVKREGRKTNENLMWHEFAHKGLLEVVVAPGCSPPKALMVPSRSCKTKRV